MRIGFQIFQCPVSDSIRNALYNIILLNIGNEYAKSFKFSHCAIINSEMLCSFLVSHIPPQNILLFFCKRLEAGLSFLNKEIMANRTGQKNNQFNEKTRSRQEKNKTRDWAIIVIQCCREDVFSKFCGEKENNQACDSESCQMTWGQFKKAQKRFDIFNCCHNLKLTMRATGNRNYRRSGAIAGYERLLSCCLFPCPNRSCLFISRYDTFDFYVIRIEPFFLNFNVTILELG